MCQMCFNKKNKIHNSGQHRKHLVLCFASILKNRGGSERHLLSFWMGLDQLQVPICQRQVQLRQKPGNYQWCWVNFTFTSQTHGKSGLVGNGSVPKKKTKKTKKRCWGRGVGRSFACLHVLHKMRFLNIRQLQKGLNHMGVHFCIYGCRIMEVSIW